jgi:agmatine/peptidylarginine deiminase
MNRKLFGFLLLFFVSVSIPALGAQPESTQEDLVVLPRGQTLEEKQSDYLEALLPSYYYPWECDADTYGFTPPPAGDFRFTSEYESTTGVLVGWPSYGCIFPEITELIRNGIERLKVTVLVPPSARQHAENCLHNRGLTDSQISQIDWVEMPIDSNWIRDYGPEIVSADGLRYMIDMSYYPQLTKNCRHLFGRVKDDAVPSRLPSYGGASWNNPVFRPKLRMEGGNLQTDGNGTCFRTRRVTNARNDFSRWSYTEEELNEVIKQYYNCDVVVLESMVGGVIDHIDMWMTVISAKTILVGKYEPEDDPENAAILDRNARTLEKLGYRVVRIPMPKPYCIVNSGTCVGGKGTIRTCDQPNTTRVWATFLNSIRLGDAMIVPVYKDVPPSLRTVIESQEREALKIFQRELDRKFGKGAVKVIPVVSDVIIPCQGAAHCSAITYQ